MKGLTLVCACFFLCGGIVVAQSNPVPFINQPLVPDAVAPGSGEFTLTVNGTGFAPTAAVRWNGKLLATTVLSSSRVRAKIKASDVASAGMARVAVVNVDAHNEASNIVYFPVRTPAPSVAFAQNPDFSIPGVPGYFTGDGKLDMVNVYASSSTTLEADVYLNEGDLQFGPPIQNQFSGYVGLSVGGMVVGDFNGDHHLDIVVSLRTNGATQLTTLVGDGTGRFTLAGSSPGSFYPLFSADIDGDGNLDVVAIYGPGRFAELAVLYGDGNGGFSPVPIPSAGDDPVYAITGDFNEDGLLDLAVYNHGYAVNSTVGILLNKGNRTFSKGPARYQTPAAYEMLTADINGDGHLDIVTDSGAVFLGNGKGRFTNGEDLSASGFDIIAGDFNGDGKLDLVEEGSTSRLNLSVFLGNGDGTFQSPIETNGFFGSLSDFSNDGLLDLVGSGYYIWQVPANLYPGSLQFGQQPVGTQSPPQTATLSNAGAEPLAGIQITLTGTDAQNFSQQNNCPSSLPVNGSCQIQVIFAPISVGDKSASLSVAYNGLGSPQAVVLNGLGVATTSVSLLPSSLTFATQNLKTTSAPQVATLTNTGSLDVTISKISTSAQFGQSNNCPATLPAGKSCQINVTFSPTAVGQDNGTLSVTDNAPGSPQTVALSGVGTLIKLSPIGINFGSQKVGTSSSPVPVTLSNHGTITLNISQIEIGGANPGDFSQTNNCGSSLPAGAHCTIQVTFTPTQTGNRSAELEVQDDVNPTPQDVALGGTGT